MTALRRIVRAIDVDSRRLVQRHGITGPQAVLLRELLAEPSEPLTVGELARRVNLGQATVTEILDRLEQRRLVTRTRSDVDRRRVLLSATAAAAKVLRDASPLLEERFAAEFNGLDASEQARIVDSLEHVAAMMGAAPLDSASLLSSELLPPTAAEPEPPSGSGSGRATY